MFSEQFYSNDRVLKENCWALLLKEFIEHKVIFAWFIERTANSTCFRQGLDPAGDVHCGRSFIIIIKFA